ncbi:hypothetical protein Efla_005805 [Eimeria flavescens]
MKPTSFPDGPCAPGFAFRSSDSVDLTLGHSYAGFAEALQRLAGPPLSSRALHDKYESPRAALEPADGGAAAATYHELFLAYVSQQQELEATSRTLRRAHEESASLRNYLKALERQKVALKEAAAKREAAAAERMPLEKHLRNLEESLSQERHWCEMHLPQETHRVTLRQFMEARRQEVAGPMKAAEQEAISPKEQLQVQQHQSNQLKKLILQLQGQAAKHVHTTDHLSKALAACGWHKGGGAGQCSLKSEPIERPFGNLLQLAQQLLAVLLEFSGLLLDSAREGAIKLFSSRLAEKLPRTHVHKGNLTAPNEEALLAHRLLLGCLISTRLPMPSHTPFDREAKALQP